jgi:hypothetical protein
MLAEGWLLQGLVAVDALQHVESMLAAPPEMLQEAPPEMLHEVLWVLSIARYSAVVIGEICLPIVVGLWFGLFQWEQMGALGAVF